MFMIRKSYGDLYHMGKKYFTKYSITERLLGQANFCPTKFFYRCTLKINIYTLLYQNYVAMVPYDEDTKVTKLKIDKLELIA